MRGNAPEAEALKRRHYQWLLETGQEEEAGRVKEKDGDFVGAINLFMQGGLPARAAQVIIVAHAQACRLSSNSKILITGAKMYSRTPEYHCRSLHALFAGLLTMLRVSSQPVGALIPGMSSACDLWYPALLFYHSDAADVVLPSAHPRLTSLPWTSCCTRRQCSTAVLQRACQTLIACTNTRCCAAPVDHCPGPSHPLTTPGPEC